jgi:hypothetical protein
MSYLEIARPFNCNQSCSGLISKLVFQAASNTFIGVFNSLPKLINALMSFGKHVPPKPNLPSGPGICK